MNCKHVEPKTTRKPPQTGVPGEPAFVRLNIFLGVIPDGFSIEVLTRPIKCAPNLSLEPGASCRSERPGKIHEDDEADAQSTCSPIYTCEAVQLKARFANPKAGDCKSPSCSLSEQQCSKRME